jgi:ASC-1-like (ASCH) protein
MKTLKIVIKKEWFDKIKSGEKTIEYREKKPFWDSRLNDEKGNYIKYDRIEFINGYVKNARRMITAFGGVSLHGKVYHIEVGKIIK